MTEQFKLVTNAQESKLFPSAKITLQMTPSDWSDLVTHTGEPYLGPVERSYVHILTVMGP